MSQQRHVLGQSATSALAGDPLGDYDGTAKFALATWRMHAARAHAHELAQLDAQDDGADALASNCGALANLFA